MNHLVSPLVEYIGTFLVIIGIVKLLKYRGIFKDSHQPVFDRLVTEFALPAILFGLIATTDFQETAWLLPVTIMILATVATILIAIWICRGAGLSPAKTGSIVLLSAFGSSYTVGMPVISSAYGLTSQQAGLGNALCVFGVVIPLFTVGILVAGYFGRKERGEDTTFPTLHNFESSPIFLAFVFGIAIALICSFFSVPGNSVVSDVFSDFFTVIRHSLSLFVWIALGLRLHTVQLRSFLPLLGLVVLLHMILLPAFVMTGSLAAGLPQLELVVAGFMAVLPSGAIAAVIAGRYGCDGELASALLIGTYVVGFIALPVIFSVITGP
jgi:predicted permease